MIRFEGFDGPGGREPFEKIVGDEPFDPRDVQDREGLVA